MSYGHQRLNYTSHQHAHAHIQRGRPAMRSLLVLLGLNEAATRLAPRVVRAKQLVEVLERQRVVGRELLVVPVMLGRVDAFQEANRVEGERGGDVAQGQGYQRELEGAELIAAVLQEGAEGAEVHVKAEDIAGKPGAAGDEHDSLLEQDVRLVGHEVRAEAIGVLVEVVRLVEGPVGPLVLVRPLVCKEKPCIL